MLQFLLSAFEGESLEFFVLLHLSPSLCWLNVKCILKTDLKESHCSRLHIVFNIWAEMHKVMKLGFNICQPQSNLRNKTRSRHNSQLALTHPDY